MKAFSLVEMLVSITILALISGAIYSTFVINQRSFQLGQEREEIIQNGRVILERLSRELRQARELVTSLPDTSDIENFPPPSEIFFQDGHLPILQEEKNPQGASNNTILLSTESSLIDDYYKGTFVEIISGQGQGEIKKIIEYKGTTKEATILGEWEETPNTGSVYRIDTSYLYVRYYLENNNLKRSITVYYFSGIPSNFAHWSSIPPEGQTLEELVLEELVLEDDIVGEFVSNLEFWGAPVINVLLELSNRENNVKIQTKIFGRNL